MSGIDYAKILDQRKALEEAVPCSREAVGLLVNEDGELERFLVAPNEATAERWRDMFPGIRVVVSQPLPTGGNPPHRKGRPEGLR